MEYDSFLENMLNKISYQPIMANSLEETIYKTIVGTSSTTRLGTLPSEEAKKEILWRIGQKVKQGYPLEVTSAWGAIKTMPIKERGVDLSELLALKQFHAISSAVRMVYPPGVRFNIYLGDSFYSYLYGNDDRIEDYCEGMKLLANEYEEININRLGVFCNEIDCCEELCGHNYELIKNYWYETIDIPQANHTTMISYQRLAEAGWVGIITPAMREFYINRMEKLYPEETDDYRTDKVIKYFAYGLMISQNDLMGRKNHETCTIDACWLRVPPPDIPRQWTSNRIRMRIVPTKISKKSAPPWTIIGVLCKDSYGKMRIDFLDINSKNIEGLEKLEYKSISIFYLDKRELF